MMCYFVFQVSGNSQSQSFELGLFATPKLLQPRLQNPENCKQAPQEAWKFIPHSTAYFTIQLHLTVSFSCF